MTPGWTVLARLIVATATGAAVVGAPVAAADPAWPVAGAESARDTIRDLREQGYRVAINWVNGYSSSDLSTCNVSAIYNPDRSPDPQPPESTTVYVDVACPHDHDGGGVDVGVGVGF